VADDSTDASYVCLDWNCSYDQRMALWCSVRISVLLEVLLHYDIGKVVHTIVYSFSHSSKNSFRWRNVTMIARTPNNVKRKDGIRGTGRHVLSCEVEAVRIASGKK